MSIHESSRKLRDRWPLEFDLEGIPRDTVERERLVQQKQELENPQPIPEEEDFSAMAPKNQFAVDYQQANNVVDINNPPKQRYAYVEYPKMLYKEGAKPITVNSAEEEQKKLAEGWQTTPVVKAAEPQADGSADSAGDGDQGEATAEDFSEETRPARRKR
jgi:hypothetical protein